MKNMSSRIIIVAVILVLLATIGYLLFTNSQKSSENEVLMENKEQLETEIVDLEADLKNLQTDIERKDLAINEKDQMLADKTAELEKKQKQIDQLLKSGKINKQQSDEYKAKIDQLNYYIQKYQAEIAELRAQNQKLTEENQALASSKDSIKEKASEVENQNKLMSTKLEAAAILKASDFQFSTLNKNGKESDKDIEFKAGKIDKLKICFVVQDNAVAKIGNRDLYVVIQKPDGSTNKNMESTSGNFTLNGKESVYSVKQNIEYDRSNKKVCVNYSNPAKEEFMKGVHKVLVYSDGYEIGKSEFKVK